MDPQLVRQSVDEVPESLRGLVQFVQGDLAMVDLPSADIVFLYLPQEATLKVLKDGFPALRGAARILVADPPGALQSNPARYGLRLLSSSAQQLPRLDVYEQLQGSAQTAALVLPLWDGKEEILGRNTSPRRMAPTVPLDVAFADPEDAMGDWEQVDPPEVSTPEHWSDVGLLSARSWALPWWVLGPRRV
ncbi:HERC1 [Symbiodinium sp. KB8]|nr:HERC1 [Symbiodinium sp. KB8]